jgi:adhesin/invasin
MRFLPRLALLCGALLFLFGAFARPAAAQSGAIGIRGDVTADGNLTASDALAVLSHVVGKPLPAGYSAELDGDADGNGQVTALDALVILGRVVGKDVARYPVGRRLLSGTVGAAGGSVVSRADSIRMELPEGALSDAVYLTVEPAAAPAAPGLLPGSVLAIGPDGQRFAKPVRLTLRYDPAAVPGGTVVEELRIHRRVGNAWEEVPGGTVDARAGVASAMLAGAGTYAILPRAATGLTLVKVAGDNQTGTVGQPPADFLVARLVNAAGRGIPNQVLTWTVIQGGGIIRPLEERTDSAGRVRAVFTLGPDAGLNRVSVRAAGADSVVFTATGVSAAPASIVVVAGDGQTAVAGSAVATPPSVRVTDSRGNPVADATVTFAVATGGGSITGATPKTDGNGIATVGSWTLGTTAGPNSLTATLAGGLSVTINATGIPGAAASISKQSGDGGTAVVATTRALEAKVVDANGNGVAGVTVSWAVATGGGSLSTPSSVTDGSGVASVVWTFGGTVGTQSVTATAAGLTGSPLTFSATTTPAAASRLAITTQPSAAAQSGIALPQQPVVQLRDAFGNAVAQSGTAVTAALASGTGTLGGTATVNTDAAGVATFTNLSISGPVGAYTLGFSASGLTGATSGTINLAAGAPASMAVNAGDAQTATAGSAVATAPSVRVTDGSGNPVSGVSVTFAVATGGGSVTGATQTTDAAGIATVGSWTLGTTAGANTLTATAGSLSATFTATGTAGAAANIAKTAGDAQTASVGSAVATAPSVTITDQYGNPVSGVSVTFAASGNGSVTGTPATTNASGVATVGSWTLATTVGANTLSATAGALSTSFTATGTVGAPANIAKTAGDGQTATVGSAVATAPSVTITDQYGNAVPGVSVTFAASGNGSVTGSPATTNASGVATVGSWTLTTTVGANTLTATAGSLSASFTATGTVGAAANITKTAGAGQTATAGSAVATAPSVTITDQYGNPVAGVSVTFAASGDGSVTGSPATTNASGVATVGSWTLATTVGANTLTATAGALSTSFTATGTAGAAANIAKTAGDGQTATVGSAVATAPSVTITDQYGNPVAGVSVTFAASGDGSVTGSPATTNASGVATVGSWTLATTVGANTLTATAGALSTSFSATGTVGGPANITKTAGDGQTATVGSAVATAPSVTITDQYGNPVAGVSVTFAASGDGSVTGSPATTNASGVATVGSWTLATTVGANTLTATAGALSASFSATGTVGAAANINKTAGDGQSATAGSAVATAPSVTITDQYGNPVAGVSVTFAASGDGSVTSSPATTNASGVATVGSWTLATTIGANTLTATAGALSTSFSANGTSGAAANIAKTAGDGQTATVGSAVATAPSVTITDQYGNPVAGVSVTFAASGDGSVTGSPATTNASGVATVGSWTLATTVGANTLTATAGALSTTFSATGTAAAASRLVVTTQPSGSVQSGTAFPQQPAVQLRDAFGNAVSQAGVTVTASIATGGGTLGGTTTASTDAGGVATFTNLSISGLVGDRTLSFSAAGLTAATSNTVSVTAGAASQLAVTTEPSATVQNGVAFPQQPTVQLRDAAGNPVGQAGVTVTAAIASGGGTLGGTTTATTGAGGAATFTDLSITGTLGSRTLRFSAAGLADTTSAAINVTAGAASQLAITTQPSDSVQSGIAFPRQPAVQLRDASGNPVGQAGVTVTAALASGGPALGGTTTATTDASGVATFTDLSITGTVGDRTLSFSASGLTSATSANVHVRAGTASQLTITTEPSDSVQGGTAFPRQPAVQLRDASGNPVGQAGVTVTAAIASGGGTLGGTTTATTNASGVATFTNLSITGAAGARTLSFSATGLTPATSAGVYVKSGPPARLAIVTQPSATAQAGVVFAQQPAVQVQDASGNPVAQSGVTVTAAIATGTGALGGATTAITDASGVATFTNLSIGGTAGSRTLAFSASGLAPDTSATINVTVGPAAALEFSVQPSNAVASAPITPAVQVRVVDAFGNLVTGASDNIAIAIGSNPSGGTLSGTVSVAATGGVATFSDLSINLVGAGYTLAASTPSLGTATSAGFNVTHGPLDHFLVQAAGGGPIGNQLAGTPFNVRVIAQDAYNNTVTSFTGTVGFTSTPSGGISGGATSGAFAAGVLSSHAVTFGTPGSFTLTATRSGGTETGTSNSFDVQAPPTAVNEGPAAGSAPGQPFHAFFSTSGSPQTFTLAAPGVLSNDILGFPAATITSFGADSLGGSVTTYPAGSTVSPLPGTGRTTGSLSVAADGTVTFTPPDGFTGNYVFRYRLTNVRGTSDGQVTIAVGARPVAVNDAYSPVLVGNVPINTATSTQFRITANNGSGPDQGDAKVFAITGSTGGTATINADSTFTFQPTTGYNGPASFSYTITNGFGTTAAATVSMTVGTPIWFVNSAAAAGGDGRFNGAFNTLASFAAVNNGTGNNPAASDRVFLYTGSYTGGVTLLNGQQFVGQGATGSSLSTVLGVAWPADSGPEPAINGTSPTITSATTGITLGSGNTLRGFNLGNVTGTALSGTSFGTLVVSNVGINTTGQALSLTTGTLNGGFTQLRSTGGANNVFLSGVATTGTSTLGAAGDVLSGATGDAFVVAGGTGSFTYSGSVTQASNAALLNVSGGHSGTLTFQTGTLSATNGTGLQFDNADGSYVFTGTPTLNGGNAGIDVSNGSSGTFSFPSTASITNPTAEAVAISGSAPTFTYSGSLSKTNNASSGITLSSNTGGTITFDGPSKVFSTQTANAVNILGNGATVVFADSLKITTSTGVGFNATGGGTVRVAGTHNSITSAGGVALNVSSTTIGTGGLNFRSISANGGANGIVLNNTGSTAGLTVTGTGTAGSGGTIQNTTGDGVRLASTRNASLSWMNFSGIASAVNNAAACNANLASGCESAVDMDNATNVTLDRININGAGQTGISAYNTSGLTVTNSQVLNVGDADGESGILLHNLSGTSLIQDVTVDNPEEFGIKLFNTTGTAGLTLRRVTVQNNIGTFGEAGFQAEVSGGTTTALVDDSDFLNTDGTGVFGTSSATGVLNLTVQASTFTNNQALPSGVNFTTGGTSTGRLTATGNVINGCATLCSQGFDLDASISSTLEATVLNNTIANAGIGTGIEFISNENSVARGRFEGNNITVQNTKVGMNFHARPVTANPGTASMDLTLKSNTISGIVSGSPGAVAYGGVQFQAGSSLSTDHNQNSMCVNLATAQSAGNNVVNGTNDPGLVFAYTVRQRSNTTFKFQGFAGTGTSDASVQSFITSNNPGGTMGGSAEVYSAAGSGNGATIVNYTSGTCATPSATPTP